MDTEQKTRPHNGAVSAAEIARITKRLSEAIDSYPGGRARLAKKLNRSTRTLLNWTSGKTKEGPQAADIAALADALDVSADWLLGRTNARALGADDLRQALRAEYHRFRREEMGARSPKP